jgi:hypothetical protein
MALASRLAEQLDRKRIHPAEGRHPVAAAGATS